VECRRFHFGQAVLLGEFSALLIVELSFDKIASSFGGNGGGEKPLRFLLPLL
jgi:hypothetical protein